MSIKIEHGYHNSEKAAANGDSIIIIDVLRASTTYTTALANGAKQIIPCKNKNDLKEKFKIYKNALRSGERNCEIIEGYDLGSSPLEMINAEIKGKSILSSTTNGSKMIVAASMSPLVVIGCFNNISAVSKFMSTEKNITIICAGRHGLEVPEDTICANLIKHIMLGGNIHDFDLSISEIKEKCKQSKSYLTLKSAGLSNDFDYCMEIDNTKTLVKLEYDKLIVMN